MERIPIIKAVEPVTKTQIHVIFDNGSEKIYDCAPLLSRPQFQLLTNGAFFRTVHVEPGGYGVSWSDDIDLSEYELWTNGKDVAKNRLLSYK